MGFNSGFKGLTFLTCTTISPPAPTQSQQSDASPVKWGRSMKLEVRSTVALYIVGWSHSCPLLSGHALRVCGTSRRPLWEQETRTFIHRTQRSPTELRKIQVFWNVPLCESLPTFWIVVLPFETSRPAHTASHHGRLECSAAPLWEPQIHTGLMFHIGEVPGSNLGYKIGCPKFSSAPPSTDFTLIIPQFDVINPELITASLTFWHPGFTFKF